MLLILYPFAPSEQKGCLHREEGGNDTPPGKQWYIWWAPGGTLKLGEGGVLGEICSPLEATSLSVTDSDRSPWAPVSVVMSLAFAVPPIREKPQEWGWNCPIFHLWLPFVTPTIHAASPQKECKGDTATAIECWGRVWRRQSHKIHSPPLQLIYFVDCLPDRRGTGWWSCFYYVPLAGVRKSTNKQDLSRRNISTP